MAKIIVNSDTDRGFNRGGRGEKLSKQIVAILLYTCSIFIFETLMVLTNHAKKVDRSTS